MGGYAMSASEEGTALDPAHVSQFILFYRLLVQRLLSA